ncbi:MAG: hypothetical protein QXX38_00110 [Candidatus Aenigmatarchaeota archaeon]
MFKDDVIKRAIRRFKKMFPCSEGLEKELIPLGREEAKPRTLKKRKG